MFLFHCPHNKFVSCQRKSLLDLALSSPCRVRSGGSSSPAPSQSQLQGHPEPKPRSENGCLSKPVLPKLSRRIWILAAT